MIAGHGAALQVDGCGMGVVPVRDGFVAAVFRNTLRIRGRNNGYATPDAL